MTKTATCSSPLSTSKIPFQSKKILHTDSKLLLLFLVLQPRKGYFVKGIIEKYNSVSLVLRIVIGLVIGAILALFIPSDGSLVPAVITLLGTLFVNALKAVAPILVFFLIISALCNAEAPGSMKTIIILYIVSTFVAALVAVIGSYLFPMELTLAAADDITQSSPSGIGEVLNTLLMNIVANPVAAIVNANYIGILVWAAMLGVALRAASDTTKNVFANVSDAIATIVRWIISLAPFGILGLVYDAVATNGMEIFIEYGQLILLLVACMFFIALVANPILVFILTRKNPYPLVLRCAAVTITVMAMQAANTVGLTVDIPTAVILSALAAVSACGASGVPGGSLLLIPLACSLFGIPNDVAMQVVAIGFIIGVIQDSCETALNSSSDAVFTATAEYRTWIKKGRDFVMGKNNTPMA